MRCYSDCYSEVWAGPRESRITWGVLQAMRMSRLILHSLMYPIVQAPMAGGPSTPSLAAAVSGAGGLGFLAAGYKTVDRVERELAEVRSLMPVGLPYGLNLLAPPGHGTGAAEVSSYADKLRNEAQERDVALGNPRWDDDQYGEKLDLLCEQAVPVVSLTFGCPTPSEVDRLQSSGSAVWITVTTVGEARAAQHVGADALVVQGVEAGGHRGGFDDAHPGDIGLLALLQLVQAAVNDGLPLIAAGGLITGRGVAAVLACGAAAAQLGTAFMLCPEAGTVPAHQDMISRDDAPTAHPSVHRPNSPRHRQPLPRGPRRCAQRVPRDSSSDRSATHCRANPRRHSRLPPLGRPSACPGPTPPSSRARRPPRSGSPRSPGNRDTVTAGCGTKLPACKASDLASLSVAAARRRPPSIGE